MMRIWTDGGGDDDIGALFSRPMSHPTIYSPSDTIKCPTDLLQGACPSDGTIPSSETLVIYLVQEHREQFQSDMNRIIKNRDIAGLMSGDDDTRVDGADFLNIFRRVPHVLRSDGGD